MRKCQRATGITPNRPGIVVVDDAPFLSDGGSIRPWRSDFYRFSLQLGRRAARPVIFCSPLVGEKKLRRTRQAVFDDQAELIVTFPGTRVTEYVRLLPLALLWNVLTLAPAIYSSDLVVIRVPEVNGLLAFMIAAIFRKPAALFLVGPPAAGALVRQRGRLRRAGVRLAAGLEWTVIAQMARRAPAFAYGRDLAHRLAARGAWQVVVTFTSLVEEVPDSTAPQTTRGAAVTLLFAGRFVVEKGIDVLLDAAARCAGAGPSPRVILVGDGPIAPALRRHASSVQGLDVEFRGWLHEGPELDKAFGEADIFVYPSRADGIPKVLLKAMAHGLPIVATSAGGIPDIVSDGHQGLLVPPGDARGLASALMRLASDPGLRRLLGGRGQDFAREHTAGRQADAIWQEIVTCYPSLATPEEG